MSRNLSPFDLNPLKHRTPLDLIVRFVDYDGIKKRRALFIAATNVQTGKLHVFHNKSTPMQ